MTLATDPEHGLLAQAEARHRAERRNIQLEGLLKGVTQVDGEEFRRLVADREDLRQRVAELEAALQGVALRVMDDGEFCYCDHPTQGLEAAMKRGELSHMPCCSTARAALAAVGGKK